MKYLLIILTVIYRFTTFSQPPCSNTKIETPAVPKPTNGTIVSATCTQLVVGWQGGASQSYIVQASYINPSTKKRDTIAGSNISCNSAYNCTSTIPVLANTKVSWWVQAVGTVDSRTFYSYPFRGQQDYPIPACSTPITKAAKVSQEQSLVKSSVNKLSAFPNPVSGELTVKWDGEYTGDATMTVTDAAGKEVRRISLKKGQKTYANRIQVNALTPGVYYLRVRTAKGETMTTKFVKE